METAVEAAEEGHKNSVYGTQTYIRDHCFMQLFRIIGSIELRITLTLHRTKDTWVQRQMKVNKSKILRGKKGQGETNKQNIKTANNKQQQQKQCRNNKKY